MQFDGKVAIVTGAGRGIGRAIVEVLTAGGARVAVADRDGDAARAAAHAIGENTLPVEADVADPEAVAALVTAAEERLGGVDILVNNAGIGATRLVVDTPLDEWERILRVNLTGAFLCSQAVARRMIARGKGGRIVNIVSISGQRGGIGRGAYGASKAGLEVLTRILAVELAPHGIAVNAVAPGPVATDTAREMHTRETIEAYHRLIPQRRYGAAAEVAAAVAFLASAEASYVTGHTLNVDGGFGAAGLMFPFDPARDRPVGSAL